MKADLNTNGMNEDTNFDGNEDTNESINEDNDSTNDITKEQGKIFAITGNKADTATMLISLAQRLQKRNILFIDAAHCFNQPFVKKNYHKKEIDLKGISIARPFTKEQFMSIIQNLHVNIVKNKARAIFIAGFDRFLTTETESLERAYLTEQAMEELVRQTINHDVVTFISLQKDSIIQENVLPYVQLCTRL